MLIQVKKGKDWSSVELETIEDLLEFIQKNGGEARIYKGTWTVSMPEEWLIDLMA